MTHTPTRLTIPAKRIRKGDVLVSTSDGETFRNTATTDARTLGGTGLVAFGLTREGRDPWDGRLAASSLVDVERMEGRRLDWDSPAPADLIDEFAEAEDDDERPSLAEVVALAQNRSNTDPTWRGDYR